MKKKSKVIRKKYNILEENNCNDKIEYYGLIRKNKRIKVDTRRYQKFFELPSEKIKKRKTVYYLPSKVTRYDYFCNQYRDYLSEIKETWDTEYKAIISKIKTPEQYSSDVGAFAFSDGVLEYEEAQMVAMRAKWKRSSIYASILKCIYTNYFGEIMPRINSLSLKIFKKNGYKKTVFDNTYFKNFIKDFQSKKKTNIKELEHFNYFKQYDKYRLLWNLLKHNTKKLFDELKAKYPELIEAIQSEYNDGDYSLYYLKIDENFLNDCIKDLKLFHGEKCLVLFGEDIDDAQWDYDDYFLAVVNDEIDTIINPLGLPDYI